MSGFPLEWIAAQQQAMLDREAIATVLTRYCRAIDRLDLDLLKSVFHPDAINEDFGKRVNAHDWADAVIPALAGAFTATLHNVTNLEIVVEDDRAVSESHFIAYHRIVGDRVTIAMYFGEDYAMAVVADADGRSAHDYIGTGRYLHRWEKRDGHWRMTERVTTMEFNQFAPISRGGAGSVIGSMPVLARRDRSDRVYALFANVSGEIARRI